ncbi:hypothetical protein [Kribbella speibonae]|uniref:Secreted protein n=1 Tax=Kribbella speibonae TaxID=1572660 RepID=A0ABY1ZXJ5_9ACTN|nr:hypothetical protein [Kribbella speibonae]TCC19623.1 hypothetical protein E0H58_32580 [Kribbella speibonae]
MTQLVQWIARTRIGRITAAFVLAATGLSAGAVAAAGPADAATCYGGAKVVDIPWSYDTFYLPASGTWSTSSRCEDINLKLTDAIIDYEVRVCFFPSSGGMSCQGSYKKVGKSWKVIASDVKDGTKFKFQFRDKPPALDGFAAF